MFIQRLILKYFKMKTDEIKKDEMKIYIKFAGQFITDVFYG